MHKIFSYTLTVQKHQIDFLGHVNNSVYLTLFEDARWDLLTHHGYNLDRIHQTGLCPIILGVNIRFSKELRAFDEISIETQLIEYVRKVGKLRQVIKRNNDICCEAEFTFGLFDMNERKLMLPNEEWLSAIGYVNNTSSK